jgi:hypothetical protein
MRTFRETASKRHDKVSLRSGSRARRPGRFVDLACAGWKQAEVTVSCPAGRRWTSCRHCGPGQPSQVSTRSTATTVITCTFIGYLPFVALPGLVLSAESLVHGLLVGDNIDDQ